MKNRFLEVFSATLLFALLALSLRAATFPVGGGAVPVNITDNNSTGITRTFTVTGVTGFVAGVRLTLNMTHTWVGDLRVRLTSPDAETHIMFYDIGDTNTPVNQGDSSNLSGAYVMRDDAATTLWTGAEGGNSNFTIPPGNYRSTNLNVNTATNISSTFGYPGPALSDMLFGKEEKKTFDGIAPGLANGTWTLVISDNATGDTGTLNAGTQLELVVPTAASGTISGRALGADGKGLGGVTVELAGGPLQEPLRAITNQFGRYEFADVQLGDIYILNVSSKRYIFDNPSRVINLQDNITDADFTGTEQ